MRIPDNYLVADKIYDVTVTGIKESGLIVLLDGTEYTALIHISMLSSGFVSDVSKFASVGDNLKAKAVKWKNKIELSIKACEESPKPETAVPDRPAREHSDSRELDRMIASCEAHYKDKMRGRGGPSGSQYTRKRSPKRKPKYYDG